MGSPRPKATQLGCSRSGLAHEALDTPGPRLGPGDTAREMADVRGGPALPALHTHHAIIRALSPDRGFWMNRLQLWESRARALPSPVPHPHQLHNGPADLGSSALEREARDRAAFVWAGLLGPGGPHTLGIHPPCPPSSSVASLAAGPPGWLSSCPLGPSALLSPSMEGRVPYLVPHHVCPPTIGLVVSSQSRTPTGHRAAPLLL